MPEAPDLEVVREVLAHRVVGQTVVEARVLKPTVLRSLAASDISQDMPGHAIEKVSRRGKFLTLAFSGDRLLVINPMLTGLLQLCSPDERLLKRTCLSLTLDGDLQLRYLDDRQMGLVYYVSADQLSHVPRFHEQGPDVLDNHLSFEDFRLRLRTYQGEIKGILTRGTFMAGVGNAYADEILFAAGLSPFRRRKTLSEEDVRRLYDNAQRVVEAAVVVLRERMGENLHQHVRDFLQVHNKGGQPCPRCGHAISQLTANQRITSYCRHCQPGMLLRN